MYNITFVLSYVYSFLLVLPSSLPMNFSQLLAISRQYRTVVTCNNKRMNRSQQRTNRKINTITIFWLSFSNNVQEVTKMIRKLDKFHIQLVVLILVSPDVETFSYFILTTDIKIIVAFEFIRHKAHKRKLSKGTSQKSVRM